MSVNSTNRSILANYLMGQGSSSTIGRNYVRNEFARDGVANVTASGTATVAKNTTTPLTAISDFLVTLPNNTTDYVEWTLDTLDNALKNQNCMMSFDYLSTTVGSAVQAQIVIGGTVVSTSNISTAAGQSQVRLNAPCGTLAGATTVRISNATGNTGTSSLNVANMNYGRADNVYDAPLVTNWASYTPTFTGFGTVTNIECKARRVGENQEGDCKFTTGTNTAVEARISLYGSVTSAGISIIPSIRGVGQGVLNTAGSIADGVGSTYAILAEPSVGYVTVGTRYSGVAPLTKLLGTGMANSSTHSFTWSVPILGWSAVSAVSADQTDYDWTSYTPTFTGFGTVTSPECQHSRVASNLLLRCKFTNGTPTAVEARVSLPNSLVSADTVKIPSISVTGYGSENSVGVTPIVGATHSVLIEPSVGYVTFGFRNGSQGALTKTTGSSGFTSSTAFSFIATIPIQGWSSNQRAPTLVGSVTSNASNAKRIEVASVNCSASSVGDDFLSSPTNLSSGICTFTISAGYSVAPKCFIQRVESTVTGNADWQAKATSPTSLTTVCVSGGVACTGGGNLDIMCIGNR